MIRRRVDYEQARGIGSRLLEAVEKRNTLNTRDLLNAGADPNLIYGNQPILHYASVSNIRFLLDRGANIDLTSRRGYTALNALCESHYPANPDMDNTDKIELLLRRGADPNLANATGDTPLHHICGSSMDPEIVQLLVAHGAEVGQLNNAGETPLHALAGNRNLLETPNLPYRECIQAILSAGVDPLVKNEDGMTASELAVGLMFPRDMIQMLKQAEKNAGGNVNMTNAPVSQNWPRMSNVQDPANFNMPGGRRRKTHVRRKAHRRKAHHGTRRSKARR